MDYTMGEVEVARMILQTKVDDLVQEFCDKYQVETSLSSTTRKHEVKTDTGLLVSSSFNVDTEVRCYL